MSLQLNLLTTGLGSSSLGRVFLDSVQELLSTLGVLDVFDLDVKSLFDVSVTNDLVNNDTDSGLGNVEDNTGLTVVEFEWHTVVDSTVDLDVNNVTDLVGL